MTDESNNSIKTEKSDIEVHPWNLEKLFMDHAEGLIKLKEAVADISSEEHDDVYFIRYLCSFKGFNDKCVEACRIAINWRKENKEIIDGIKAGSLPPKHDIISKYMIAGKHKSLADGSPLFITRPGLCNPSKLMDVASIEDVAAWVTFLKETIYIECDKQTREKGRLVKMTALHDLRNFGVMKFRDKRFMNAFGEVSKLGDKIHPQLLNKSVVCNSPSLFSWLWTLCKPFLSPRLVEKNAFSTDATTCPIILDIVLKENMPTFVGGLCNCEGGCIGGIDNDHVNMLK